MRLTGMTMHRLMTAMATEQVRRLEDQPGFDSTTPAPDDRSDAAAEQ